MAISLATAVICTPSAQGQKIEPGYYREIGRLVISADDTVQLEAGKEHQFQLYSTVFGRAGMYREVVAPVKWSITGDKAISIDRKGLLKVSKRAKHGAKAIVKADATIKDPWEPGNGYTQTVEQEIVIFDRKANPLVGIWSQTELTMCDGETLDADGSNGLKWLEFRANGSYSAAIAPFEVYRDHWGTYEYDLRKGTINLKVTGGNRVSDDLRGDGTFSIKDGELTLTGLQLYPELMLGSAPCKTKFTK